MQKNDTFQISLAKYETHFAKAADKLADIAVFYHINIIKLLRLSSMQWVRCKENLIPQ